MSDTPEIYEGEIVDADEVPFYVPLSAEEASELRRSLEESLRLGIVGDPITTTLLGVTFFHFLAGAAIGVGLSLGTGFLMSALTPRQKSTVGDRGGQELSIQRSAQGSPIAEIFGADPGDGLGGGIKLPPIVAWLSRTADGYVARKHTQTSRGGGGGKGRPKAPEVTTITYDLDALLLWCRGPARLKKLWAATDLIYNNDPTGTTVSYEAEAGGNTFAGGATSVVDADASGGHAVNLPLNGSVQFNGVAGDGSGQVLEFHYKSSVPILVEFTWVGAAGTSTFTDTLNSTNGEYKLGYHSAAFRLLNSTGNTVKIKNLTSSSLLIDKLSVKAFATPIGVPNPDIPPDDPVDPRFPPDPNTGAILATERLHGALTLDTDTLGHGGTIAAGNFAGIAVYEGNGQELPDPVVEAQWDAQHGAGSTPAFRQVATTRLSNFYLTKYQEAFPPFYGLLEHKTIRTFKDLCEYLCAEAGLEAGDYDFSDLAPVALRGVMAAPPYSPRELMSQLARLYNCYFYESDKIYGLRAESAPTVTLTDADLGWTDDDREAGDVVQLLDAELPPKTDVPRRVTVRYVDPARNYDQQQQNEVRQITTSQREATLDVQVCMTETEARTAAALELRLSELEAVPYSFTLSFEYLYLDPGTILEITESDNSTHYIRLTSIKPTLGVVECQGVMIDTALFTQFGTPSGITFEIPPVPVPAQTLLFFADIVALRAADEGSPGFYAWTAARTGAGSWQGASVYKELQGVPELVASFAKQATAGVAVTKLGAVASISAEDTLKTFTANAATDTLTATAHGLEANETVMVSNSGGALPGGLSASTLYYVKSPAANTLQLSLTAGGAAVNITSAGTGTNSVQRVLDVDLYGTDAALETVTGAQITDGANVCLIGDEVVQVRTWEQVTGFANRWRGRNFKRGLRSTLADVGGHAAGERFVLVSDAVQFVEQGIGELNQTRTYKAVTAGASYDDAADTNFAWTGGALRYPPPGVQGTKDSDGTWRFLLFGTPTLDPQGDRYKLEIVGSGRAAYTVRSGQPRPVSLTTASNLASDTVPLSGKKAYISATRVGNRVPASATGYAVQLVESERTVFAATYTTTLTASDSPASPVCSIQISPGALFALTMTITAKSATSTPQLVIADNVDGTLFTDTAGEASGTRYSVEFIDGKVRFYRNRSRHGQPFYTYNFPAAYSPGFTNLRGSEAKFSAGTSSAWESIEIQDEGAALVYSVAEQTEDFGSAQSSITVRVSQQRVIEGVEVDGRITEVTLP